MRRIPAYSTRAVLPVTRDVKWPFLDSALISLKWFKASAWKTVFVRATAFNRCTTQISGIKVPIDSVAAAEHCSGFP